MIESMCQNCKKLVSTNLRYWVPKVGTFFFGAPGKYRSYPGTETTLNHGFSIAVGPILRSKHGSYKGRTTGPWSTPINILQFSMPTSRSARCHQNMSLLFSTSGAVCISFQGKELTQHNHTWLVRMQEPELSSRSLMATRNFYCTYSARVRSQITVKITVHKLATQTMGFLAEVEAQTPRPQNALYRGCLDRVGGLGLNLRFEFIG